MSLMGHERLGRAGRKSGYVRYGPDSDQIFQRSGMWRWAISGSGIGIAFGVKLAQTNSRRHTITPL
jgi:anti-sigma-K factor RskA